MNDMLADPNSLGRVLRVGLVGAGKMGQHHAQALRRLGDGATLTAVADPSEAARAKILELFPGASPFATLDELLEADLVDVVHVCTAPSTHFEMARRVVDRGRHVYVEKPFVETSAECEPCGSLSSTIAPSSPSAEP